MRYRTIGSDPATRREVSALSLGAMLMGSRTDEATSFAILDRFAEAGGTFIDTSGNYAFWVHGTQGGESEELLGRWRRSRGGHVSPATAVSWGAAVPGAGAGTPARSGKVVALVPGHDRGQFRVDLLYLFALALLLGASRSDRDAEDETHLL